MSCPLPTPGRVAAEAGLVALGWTGTAFMFTEAAWKEPTRVFWGSSAADTVTLIWTLWHSAWSLAHGGLGLHTDRVAFPDGGTLWPATPVEGTLAAPLTLLVGAVATYNLLQVLHVGLAAGAVHALVRRTVRAGAGAALAVTPVVALSPVLLCSIQNGNVEVAQTWWVPFVGLLAWEATTWRRGLLAGAVLGLAVIANVYVGISAGVVALGLLAARSPGSRPVAALLGAAAVVAAPAMAVAATLSSGDASLVEKAPDIVFHMRLLEGSATVMGLLRPGAERALGPEGVPGAYLVGTCAGTVATVLAGLGLRWPDRLARCLAAIVAVGALLALGPVLMIHREPVVLAGRMVPLPFLLLDRLPPFSMMIELWRFSMVIHVAVALLAARALSRATSTQGLLAGALIALEALFLNPGRTAWATDRVPDAPYDAVASAIKAERGPVADLPPQQHFWPLYFQTLHHQAVGVSTELEVDPNVMPWVARDGWTLAGLQAALHARGYRWLVVHDREDTRVLQPLDDVLADLRGSGLIAVEQSLDGATTALVDLAAPGPWPTRPYRLPATTGVGTGIPSSPEWPGTRPRVSPSRRRAPRDPGRRWPRRTRPRP